MSRNQKATLTMLAAIAGAAYLHKVAKSEAAALGIPAIAVVGLGLAASALIG